MMMWVYGGAMLCTLLAFVFGGSMMFIDKHWQIVQ